MTRLTVVGSSPPRWAGETTVVMDENGQHYVVETFQMPWRSQPETLVYPTDEAGSLESVPGYGTEQHGFVAGGLGLTNLAGISDLAERLGNDTLYTAEQAERVSRELFETDFDEFMAYIGVAPTQGGAVA